MKPIITSLAMLILLHSCNHKQGVSEQKSEPEKYVAEVINGKYNTDFETAQELKGMRNTIENFTLLNKKKFENLKAYQEFGNLMEMHIERVNEYCQLDASTKSILCQKLDKMKEEVKTLQGTDMEKSKEALARINTALVEIDSTFNYSN